MVDTNYNYEEADVLQKSNFYNKIKRVLLLKWHVNGFLQEWMGVCVRVYMYTYTSINDQVLDQVMWIFFWGVVALLCI